MTDRRHADVSKYYDRTIHLIDMIGDASECRSALVIVFEDGAGVMLRDDGQACCESRYMSTDDDLGSLVGERLVRIEVVDIEPEDHDDDYVHERAFLKLQTAEGTPVTICTHNEHNGYYGGFDLTAREISATALDMEMT